jgi:hypothetical protein
LESLDVFGAKEGLTQRTLGIGVDEQDPQTDVGQTSGQMVATGALPAASLLIDETNAPRSH